MKLLVITGAFPPMPAGEADHMFHLCRRLAEHGLEVHVVTTRSNKVNVALPFKVYPNCSRSATPIFRRRRSTRTSRAVI